MGDGTSIHVRGKYGSPGVSISRKGNAWIAKVNEAAAYYIESGVPVTIAGLRGALNGMSASFVGLTHGLAFRWQGSELRAEYVPLDGPATLMMVDPESLHHAVELMER